MAELDIRVNLDPLTNLLNSIEGTLAHSDDLTALLAARMQRAVMLNFRAGGRPAWAGLKARRGRPLLDTGRLRDSITAASDSKQAVVGTGVSYAPYHQFGTAPHVITARRAKALAFKVGNRTIYRKSVNHPGIPARPFLQLTDEDVAEMIRLAGDFLVGA